MSDTTPYAGLIALAQSIASMDPEKWQADPSTASLTDWTSSTIDAAREELDRLGLPHSPYPDDDPEADPRTPKCPLWSM